MALSDEKIMKNNDDNDEKSLVSWLITIMITLKHQAIIQLSKHGQLISVLFHLSKTQYHLYFFNFLLTNRSFKNRMNFGLNE